MRLISTLQNQEQAYALSSFLHEQHIENQLEIISNTDWGNNDYGTVTCRIWIIEEDQFDEAQKIVEEFQQNPHDPRFQTKAKRMAIQPKSSEDIEPLIIENKNLKPIERPPMGAITLYLVIICSLLLMFSGSSAPEIKSLPKNIPASPLLLSPLEKNLLYDYPKAFEIIDRIVKEFGYESLEDLNSLPKKGKELLIQFSQTPYWQGIYKKIVERISDGTPFQWDTPLFEKIRKGEVWRIFTPALLHANIFHLFFNMIWLIVLGQQMEKRLGKRRYLLFIFLTAIFSNTAQYLMSGSNFLGFSGVLSAMIGFVWIRQKKAAWEGYLLEKSTMGFIFVFILLMFGLQIISFFLEIFYKTPMPIGVGNTAHLSGALLGVLLGQLNYFAWHRPK